MTDLQETILQRRSIRKYQPKSVPKQTVLAVLQLADWAPSAHNSQPWRFIFVENPEVKLELAQKMTKKWAADLVHDGNYVDEKNRVERYERFANAPALVVACLTMEGLRKFPDEERQRIERDLAVESLGAALQTLLLAAHAAGLGTCWYCAPAFCQDAVREVLGIPLNIEPLALIVMGYAAENPVTPPKKTLEKFCYVDGWGNLLL